MSIINQLDKRSGITYVYESISYWDKEKQQPRAKRKLIGKRDPLSGEILSTDGRGKKRNGDCETVQPVKPGPIPIDTTDRRFYGATYLLDEIGNLLGLTEDLKRCFPTTYKQIQSIAYYLILESDSPLFRFENGVFFTSTPTAKIFLLSEVAKFLPALMKKQGTSTLRCK